MVDTRGADVNSLSGGDSVPLHNARSTAIIHALLERNANPNYVKSNGWTVLMSHVWAGRNDCVARLLQKRRVLDSLHASMAGDDDFTSVWRGYTALHFACEDRPPGPPAARVRILLEAGANPRLQNGKGHTPLQILKRMQPVSVAAVEVLEKSILDEERAARVVQIRRLVVANSGVELWEEQGETGDDEGRMLACAVGLSERGGLPRDVFLRLMSFFMPMWAPMRNALRE